jgi:hypothetical protein
LTTALRYAELGYRVFPCIPRTKHPITEHGFKDASTDPAQIERWWSRHPTANLGIAAEGMLVVDIDGASNLWPGDPDRSADLASAGAVAHTPRGGRHYLFRRLAGKDWKCSTGKLAKGVDIRTDGGYIVAAPSEIPEGPYRWASTLELEDRLEQLPEPPVWLVADLDRLAERSPSSPTLAHVAAGDADANAIPVGQRNGTLARLAGSMRRVGMSQAEIAAALHRANEDRCRPPIASREVDQIASSIARYEPEDVPVALAENHYEQNRLDQDEIEPASPDPGALPDHLLHVPGFVDEVMRFTLDTAPYPEPVLAFAGALSLQALLAGRKVRDAMDNRTNLYVLGLANSGVGKDHARKVNARILYEAGLADCLGTGFASGEGLEDRLFVQPASLFQVDEFDGLLLKVTQAKDARHEQIVSILLQMYSTAASVYVMRAKANRERSVIDQPCLGLFATAVPKHFYQALSSRQLTNGFLARMLIVECGRRGSGRDAVMRPIPGSILDAARWWAEFKPGDNPGNLAEWHPQPRVVPLTAEATARFEAIREQADARYDLAFETNDEGSMAIWARAYEKARRLALVYACSIDRENPEIGRDAAEWAGAFVEHQTARMLATLAMYASESEFDAKRKRLLELLSRWRTTEGDRWMPFWMINRKLPWSMREHEEVRDTLLQQRLIEHTTISTRGRPAVVYRLPPTVPP